MILVSLSIRYSMNDVEKELARCKPCSPRDGLYKGTGHLLSSRHYPRNIPSTQSRQTRSFTSFESNHQRPNLLENLKTFTKNHQKSLPHRKARQTSHSPFISTMSDALIFEYLSSPRSSKRASQEFHRSHPTMNSSSNNRSNFRASASSKSGEGKRGSRDWIRGIGRKA